MSLFGRAIRKAFTWHWNLLALGAGVAVAVLSGHPDKVLPLVAAGELAYLGFLGTNRRFLKVIQALEEKPPPPLRKSSEFRIRQIIEFLNHEDRERFLDLRHRCLSLADLSGRLRMSENENSSTPMTGLRSDSLDKLLWLFLKLLHHKTTLEHFLSDTDRDALAAEIEQTRERLAQAETAQRSDRLISSLGEKLRTMEERLINYDQAVDKLELIRVELDKTEQKTTQISEMGINADGSENLGYQVDGIAGSIAASERAMEGLEFSNFLDEAEEAPDILSRDVGGLME